MAIEFTHHRDRAYARQLAVASTVRSRIVSFVVGVLTAATGLVAMTSESAWALLFGPVGLGLGIGWMLKVLILPGQIVKRLPAAWFQPRTYRFDENGIEWSSSVARSAVAWAAFARVSERPFAYLLWQDGGLAVWDVPRAPLTAEQDRELAALLADRVRPARTAPTAPAERSVEPGPQSAGPVRPPTP